MEREQEREFIDMIANARTEYKELAAEICKYSTFEELQKNFNLLFNSKSADAEIYDIYYKSIQAYILRVGQNFTLYKGFSAKIRGAYQYLTIN